MSNDVYIEGADELINALIRVDKKVKKQIVEKPFSKQAERIKNNAKQNVPRDRGTLSNAIKVRRTSQTTRGKYASKRITVSGPQVFVLEFGVKAGTKVAKKIGVRRPQPFMWAYATDNEDRILDEMSGDIFENINKEFNK